MRNWLQTPLSFFFLLVGCTCPCFAEDLANLVIEGNRATIESINSYYCQMKFQGVSSPIREGASAQYWRMGELTRIVDRTGRTPLDIRIANGKAEMISPTPVVDSRRAQVAMVIEEKNVHVTDADAWQLSLFDLPVMVRRTPAYPRLTLAAAARVGQVREAGWVTIAGQKLARLIIDLPQDRRSYEVEIDPTANWLITRCRMRIRDEDDTDYWDLRYQITRTREVKPSLFVPEEVSLSFRFKGKVVREETVSFESLTVNDPLPTMPAMPTPTRGGIVVDAVAGTAQSIDGGGRRTGRVARLGQPLTSFAAAPEVPVRGIATQVIVGWLLAASAATLLTVAGWRLRKKRRSA